MKTTEHEVDLRYTEAELHAIFARANAEDVESGGRYDARAAAINVWSHSWINDATRAESETIGTFYLDWANKNHLYLIECDEGFPVTIFCTSSPSSMRRPSATSNTDERKTLTHPDRRSSDDTVIRTGTEHVTIYGVDVVKDTKERL